jgi:hypothetical protein
LRNANPVSKMNLYNAYKPFPNTYRMQVPRVNWVDPRTKLLKAYSKVDRKKIWAGLQQKAMDHCLLPRGAVELEEQEVANNPNQEEVAPELEQNSKASDLPDFFDLGQESEEDEADEGTPKIHSPG